MSNPAKKNVTYAAMVLIEVEDDHTTPDVVSWKTAAEQRWMPENITVIKVLGVTPVRQGLINWEVLEDTDPVVEATLFPAVMNNDDRVLRMSHKNCQHPATCWERRKCRREAHGIGGIGYRRPSRESVAL